ncbi:hypothetical protein ES703_108273 [subsurface metagenome]
MVTRRRDGKTERSITLFIYITVIIVIKPIEKLIAMRKSKRIAGIGTISIKTTAITPMAMSMSVLFHHTLLSISSAIFPSPVYGFILLGGFKIRSYI